MSLVTISAIDKKIESTKEQIQAFNKSEHSELSAFLLSEMERRLENLEKERLDLLDSQSKETVSLRIYGDKVQTGKVSNRILVSVLSGFQSMVDSIAQTVDGAEGTRGKFTEKAKMLTDFQVSGVFSGSFGIILEKNYEQMEIASGASETTQILNDLFYILENSNNSQRLIESISPFGQRTVNHYKSWLKSLQDNGVNMEISWKDENAENRRLDVNYEHIRDTMFTLESINDIIVEEVEYNNVKLTGLNVRSNTFELETEDKQIIKGKSKIETIIALSKFLGEITNVKLTKSTSYSNANVANISWYLADKAE